MHSVLPENLRCMCSPYHLPDSIGELADGGGAVSEISGCLKIGSGGKCEGALLRTSQLVALICKLTVEYFVVYESTVHSTRRLGTIKTFLAPVPEENLNGHSYVAFFSVEDCRC